jgi:hypothetical protein
MASGSALRAGPSVRCPAPRGGCPRARRVPASRRPCSYQRGLRPQRSSGTGSAACSYPLGWYCGTAIFNLPPKTKCSWHGARGQLATRGLPPDRQWRKFEAPPRPGPLAGSCRARASPASRGPTRGGFLGVRRVVCDAPATGVRPLRIGAHSFGRSPPNPRIVASSDGPGGEVARCECDSAVDFVRVIGNVANRSRQFS